MSKKETERNVIVYRGNSIPAMDVMVVDETVWLSIDQMARLFGRDKSVIGKHVRAVFKDGEAVKESVWAKFAYTACDGKTYQVDYYNLDVVISVGYRVVEDASECALVVASAVDAESPVDAAHRCSHFASQSSLRSADSSPRQNEDVSISIRRDEGVASTNRYAYCARAARRWGSRSWTVTGALACGRGALAASLRRRFSFRRDATRASRPRGRAILLASQVLNI